jgi:NAD kinase
MRSEYYFVTSAAPEAEQASRQLKARYGQAKSPGEASAIVVTGGDGTMLKTLREIAIPLKKPVFGLNFGKVGLFMNHYDAQTLETLSQRIENAETLNLRPLCYEAHFHQHPFWRFLGVSPLKTGFAINEVSICNHDRSKSVFLRISKDGEIYAERVGGDGAIFAPPPGTTAYSRAAGGIVVEELDASKISITPNNAYGLEPCLETSGTFTIDVLRDKLHTADIYVDDRVIGKDCDRVVIRMAAETYPVLSDPGYLKERRHEFIRNLVPRWNKMCL